ncbi:alpha/beta fold hydrolase [Aureibaculum sp. 2210JD6-5]|uniref:alpha/beta fold hydrolase n=1 Tax=Aureibaculum sp. 2210JD6-5 TaxID=3103957 RepID=UPI002AAD9BC2|nr:alpha/beta fold hydrolase [Aureibaculum sp. 2210JD6-5]MDY7396261.1 alpha/beta fold hydrolase [Aureibaculum sp. 2210JD6-5]
MEILSSNIKGKGEPLLILHGFLGMGDNWKTLAKKFSEHYEVHLIDQRNHGRSFHSEEFSYELMVEDSLRYIEHHKLKSVNTIGHSMGGKTAMLFAVTHPDKVNKLIVADIGPKFYPRHHDTILEGLSAIDFSEQKTRGEVEEVLKEYIPEWGVRQFLLKNVYWKNKEQLAFRFNLEALKENIDEIGTPLPTLAAFNGETLFLRGENSGYITDNDVALIETHFPKALVKTVKNAGHWLHAENPTDFYDYVVSFL